MDLKDISQAVNSITDEDSLKTNLDSVLDEVKKIDNTCVFKSCKTKTDLMGANCPHCTNRFCFKHSLPEIHGCGEAAKRDERRKWLHPGAQEKLSKVKKEEVANKLERKLKSMQQSRKAKQGKSK